jgi:hypothetical protein
MSARFRCRRCSFHYDKIDELQAHLRTAHPEVLEATPSTSAKPVGERWHGEKWGRPRPWQGSW